MKRTRTLALLTALVCLCVSLTACSPKEVLKSAILKTTTALGLRQETSDEDEVDDLSYATSGGDVTFPETMDTTASKLVSEVDGDTLYVAFNGIQNRSTDYFVAGSDSLSITGYATTESTNENFQTFKIALWELSDFHQLCHRLHRLLHHRRHLLPVQCFRPDPRQAVQGLHQL